MGIVTPEPMPTYPDGFPPEVARRVRAGDRPRRASATCRRRAPRSSSAWATSTCATGKWILYTSADSVFQIAAHEDVVPLEELYAACRIAREQLTGPHAVGRVIARPFSGTSGAYTRTANRHDFSLAPPRPNHLARLRAAGHQRARRGQDRRRLRGPGRRHLGADRLERRGHRADPAAARRGRRRAHLREPRRDGHDLRAPQRPRRLPRLPARVRPVACPTCAAGPAARRPAGALLRPRLRPDHAVDRPLARVRAAGRAHARRRRATPAAGTTATSPTSARPSARWLRRPTPADDRGPGRADPARSADVRAVDVIARKRDGGSHPPEEIRFLVDGAVHGTIRDEQLAAWLMAVVLRGLDDDEVDALCAAMVESGDVIDLSLARPAARSTSTRPAASATRSPSPSRPLVAACGAPCAKMSGRGLGHTGGTLDKLEAIPGFRVDLPTSPSSCARSRRSGCAVVAQSDRLVPADRILYALRDVTATVPSPGLIATSVMSKKLAAGAEAILLDVKVGDGAFVATVEEGARARAAHGRPRAAAPAGACRASSRGWTCRSGVPSATPWRSPRRSTCCAARGRRVLDEPGARLRGGAAGARRLRRGRRPPGRGSTTRSPRARRCEAGGALGRGAGRRAALGGRRRGTCSSVRRWSRRCRRRASGVLDGFGALAVGLAAVAARRRARAQGRPGRSRGRHRARRRRRRCRWRPESRSRGCTRATPRRRTRRRPRCSRRRASSTARSTCRPS